MDAVESPAAVDTWQPGAFAMKEFAPRAGVSPWPVDAREAATIPVVALRRFRIPVPARVRVDQHTPVHVTTDRVATRPDRPVLATRSANADRGGLSGGGVQRCAGPWRTSGGWWTVTTKAWDRDEWDVTLTDGATYRVFRDRSTDAWFIEGVVD